MAQIKFDPILHLRAMENPLNAIFNKDGTPKDKEALCSYIKDNGGQLIRAFRRSYFRVGLGVGVAFALLRTMGNNKTSGTIAILTSFYGATASLTLSAYLQDNKLTLEKNIDMFKTSLERYLTKCSKNTTASMEKEGDINMLRSNVMSQADFSIFMLVDTDGKLRDPKEIECARDVMTNVMVDRHLEKINRLFPRLFPQFNNEGNKKALCPRNIDGVMSKIKTPNGRLNVYLASKDRVHVSSDNEHVPVIIEILGISNESKHTLCTHVLIEVMKYLRRSNGEKWTWKILTKSWDKGSIRFKQGFNKKTESEIFLIVEFNDKQLPLPARPLTDVGIAFM